MDWMSTYIMAIMKKDKPVAGEVAYKWLRNGRGGKVLTAVNNAIYLLTEQGELLWITTLECPHHQRGIHLPGPLPSLSVGSRLTVHDGSIKLESGILLDLSAAEAWKAPTLDMRKITEVENLVDRLEAIVNSLLDRKTPVGFGLFIPAILQMMRKQEFTAQFHFNNILLSNSWQIIKGIAMSCLENNDAEFLKRAEVLIGLGEGLTPAGDDFLGGLFFARSLISCSYPIIQFCEPADPPGWVEERKLRTNLISYTLLKDNADRQSLEPLDQFGVALLTSQVLVDAVLAASDLVEVGHSTGWSLLVGFITGILPICVI